MQRGINRLTSIYRCETEMNGLDICKRLDIEVLYAMKRSSSAYAFRIQWILEMGLWVRDGGGEAEVLGVMPARLLGIEGGGGQVSV